MKRFPMFLRTSLPLALGVLLFLAGCPERGDRVIAYGDGLGRDWSPAAPKQMRIAVENDFTRDIVVSADAPGAHYEMTVGPVRSRFMIVPEGKYELKATTEDDNPGLARLHVEPDDRNGAKGLLVKFRS